MKRFSFLLCASIILLSTIIVFSPIPIEQERWRPSNSSLSIDLVGLANEFGNDIPLVVSFVDDLNDEQLSSLQEIGIRFSFNDASNSKLDSYYLIRGDVDSIQAMIERFEITYISPQSSATYKESTRDLSIPEINASLVWESLDEYNRTLTGKGIMIADLDSGIDWTHPDFWYANGSEYDWMDHDTNSVPTNGTDYIDFDDDGSPVASEVFYIIDLDDDGNLNVTTDWLWVDNVTQNAIPDIGEPFFVVNDTNDNDLLDVGEKLVMLNKPKTKYIVEADGTPSRNIRVWDRDTNLTVSTHEDTDGHGTAVSGILNGGQIGYRKYVGVAPDAELMMIKVLGGNNEWLTVEEGLTWAYSHGADVILIEIGSWTYEYLDGSSATETLIDTITAAGVPVIAPSGNLGGKDKHALIDTATDTPKLVDFSIPPVGGPPSEGAYISEDIETVYITLLSVNDTDFSLCNFSIVMNMGGPLSTAYLHPGTGMWNWNSEPLLVGGGFTVLIESFTDVSSRGTRMLAIRISGTLPTTSGAPWHSFNVTSYQPTVFHAYISDDQSSWTGGSIWKTDVSDDYEITWPSTADSALSVASYRIRDLVSPSTIGDIASFSSRGPRIDEVQKQGVAAPGGYDIISTYSNESQWYSWYNAYGALPFDNKFASYQLFSGTSASGPHVAGTAALMLQANATCGSEVVDIIKSTAFNDSYTQSVPNGIWGYGKLDSYLAVLAVSPVPDSIAPTIGVPSASPSSPRSNETVTIEVVVGDPSGVDSVILEYHNGTDWVNLTMTLSGGFYSANIPELANGTIVTYHIFANDTLGNSRVSPDYTYTVFDPGSTSTTITTTTTETGTTSTTTTAETSTSSDTSTTGPTLPTSPNYLNLFVMLSVVLTFIVVGCIASNRRENRYR